MQPCPTHDFFLPSRNTRLQLQWPRWQRPPRERLAAVVRQLLIGGPHPADPSCHVTAEDFGEAFALLERDDIAGAAAAFESLGYDVAVIPHRAPTVVEA